MIHIVVMRWARGTRLWLDFASGALLLLTAVILPTGTAHAQAAVEWDADPGASGTQGGNGTWGTSTLNWRTLGVNISWPSGGNASFPGNNRETITVNETISVNNFHNHANYLTFDGTGSISLASGTHNLTMGSDCSFGYDFKVPLTGAGAGISVVDGYFQTSAANSFTSNISFTTCYFGITDSGSLNSGNYAGNITSTSGALYYRSNASQTLSGIISGGTSLTKDTSSTSALTLTGASTYTGATTISAGTLQLGNGGAAGTLTGTSGVSIASGATLAFDRSDAWTFGRLISGAGGVLHSGTGITTLGQLNSYTGSTTVNGGTLILAPPVDHYPPSSGNYIINNAATLRFAPVARFDLPSGSTLTFGSSGGGMIDLDTTAANGGPTLTQGPASVVTSGGVRDHFSMSDTRGLNLGGKTLTLNIMTGSDALADLDVGAELWNAGTIIKTGTGRVLMSGPIGNAAASTANIAISVNAGTMLLTGIKSVGGATVVASGATLKGTSSNWSGTTTIQNGGTLAPGLSPGTITLSGLVLNGSSVLDFDLGQAGTPGGADNDLVQVNGNLTLDGVLNVTQSPGGNFTAGTYRLINYTGTLTNNTLSVGSLPAGYIGVIDTTTAGQVNLTVEFAKPSITLSVISNAGAGSFTFNGTMPNANGFPENSSYAIITAVAGTPVAGSTIFLAAADVVTDITEALPSGWALSLVSCTDANTAISGNPAGVFSPQIVNGSTIRIDAAYGKAGAQLQCTVTNTMNGFALSGRVILDNGAGGGTAHDAVANGGETGHAGASLRLTDCSSATYATTTADATGAFSLSLTGISPGTVCVEKMATNGYYAVSANAGTTGGSYLRAADKLSFTLAADTSHSGIILGEVAQSLLAADGMKTVIAGSSVIYTHSHVAGTSASVTFTTANTPSASGDVWSSQIFIDADCNGELGTGDTPVSNPVAVAVGQTLCLLTRVTSPAGISNGATNTTVLSAQEVLNPQPGAGVLSITLTRTDMTTVGAAGLTLVKELREVAACPADASASLADGTAFARINHAQPGEFVEYRLIYRNDTPAPLTRIELHDAVPAYTRFERAMCLQLPIQGMTTCTVDSQPAVNAASGALRWSMTDAGSGVVGLQPDASGAVAYCVRVEE